MDELQSVEGQGKVTIAPSVLTTIVRLTALEQEGVYRLAPVPAKYPWPPMRGLLTGSRADEGILLGIGDEGVSLELHVVAEANANMLKLGETLQSEVIRAIEEMVGLPVKSVDVYIDDVFLPAAEGGPGVED
jgi:uncharacterized alkaline shock family protein YloU